MSDNVIEIKLFDGFSICKDGEQILSNLSNTRKTKLFVAYLLVNRNRAIPHKELFELLWSGEDYANPGTALRTLLYRFRSMLEKEGAEQLENAVISKRGTYQWNRNLDIKIDVLDFEEMSKEGMDLTNALSHRKECLKKAIELYTGPMLPDFKSEPWMLSKAAYYSDLYALVVETYIEILKNEGEYLEVARLAEEAVRIIGSSELIELEGTMAKLSLASGGKLNDTMQKYYSQIYDLSRSLYDDAARMQDDLEDDTVQQKAFICDYTTFKEIYRLQRRMQARTKATLFLGLVDVRACEEDDSRIDIMKEVVECCSWQLRCGDAVCRKSDVQLAILFPADSYEDASGVMERLKNACKERTGENTVIVYRLRPLKNARE